MSQDSQDDTENEPDETYRLPGGGVAEKYKTEDGVQFCIRENPNTSVQRVWVGPADIEALCATLGVEQLLETDNATN